MHKSLIIPATAALFVAGVASADTVALKDSPDWTVFNFNGATSTASTDPANTPGISYGYEPGPAVPPVGPDSFFAEINANQQKVTLGYSALHQVRLADVEELSFWTYIDSASTNGKADDTFNWYANIYVDKTGDGTYDERIDFAATNTSTDTWAKFNITTGTITGGASVGDTFVEYLAANPDAEFNAFNSAGGLAFRLNQGDTSSTYNGFVGNLDAVTIDLAGGEATTFDLTAVPEPTAVLAGLSLLGGLVLRRQIGTDAAA